MRTNGDVDGFPHTIFGLNCSFETAVALYSDKFALECNECALTKLIFEIVTGDVGLVISRQSFMSIYSVLL